MNRDRIITRIAYVLLAVLLPIELFARYDTMVRQIALSVTCLAAILILVVVSRWLRLRGGTLPGISALSAAAGVWFDAMGNFVHFYARFSWWDQLAHGVGTAAVALGILAIVQTLIQRGDLRMGRAWMGMTAVCMAVTSSVLYEISEYLGDVVYPTNRVTGLFDTSDDLMWNTLAAALVVALALRLQRVKK